MGDLEGSGQTLANPDIVGACRTGGGLDGIQDINLQQDGPKTFHNCRMGKKIQNKAQIPNAEVVILNCSNVTLGPVESLQLLHPLQDLLSSSLPFDMILQVMTESLGNSELSTTASIADTTFRYTVQLSAFDAVIKSEVVPIRSIFQDIRCTEHVFPSSEH